MFLETIAREWTFQWACAAAGITRRQGIAWTREPEFAQEFFLAQEAFLDRIERAMIQAAVGRGGRVLRSSMQAMIGFLSTHHSDYNRNRLETASRMMTPLVHHIERIVKEHCPPAVVDEIREAFDRMTAMYETSGGLEVK